MNVMENEKNLRIETWLEHEIRFVEKSPNDWWAVLADISSALDLTAGKVKQRLPKDVLSKHPLQTLGGIQEMLIVNEYGIYETVFESRKKEAKVFKRWVFDTLKLLRQSTGLQGFQVFRMLDKEHQREAMDKLRTSLPQPERVDFIKANTIADKAVSTRFGHPKMLKKGEMTPDMLVERQPILDDTIDLMVARKRFGLVISVSEAIYAKWSGVWANSKTPA